MDEQEQTQNCSRQSAETQSRDARVLEYFWRYGRIFTSRGAGGRDLVGQMSLARRRLDVLARDLVTMGVSETGDDPGD